MSQILQIFIAILIVLALIGAVAWLVRRFSGGSIGSGSARGRMPRLAVIDAAAVDGRRRLVLVRRDNVEHLLMIGGPTDVVVELNIMRSASPAPQRAPAGTELPAQITPLPDVTDNWADNDTARPAAFELPEPAPERPARPTFGGELRRPPAPPTERSRGDDFSRLVPEPPTRPEPIIRPERSETIRPRSERTEPAMPRVPRPSELPSRGPAARPPARPSELRPSDAASISAADQNLAEMAQRLEAALRRPGERSDAAAPRHVSVDPMDRVGAPPVAPEAPNPRPAPRVEPTLPAEPASAAPQAAATPAAPAAKGAFESLEDEMASLLGRPKNPS
ncbi:MAG: flagellar biosynthetic protein FliO [Rhizobiales bacterium]|nr:flagellar biosynthetic protein FliO [Hyphomicrobiales bacterium]